MSQDKTPKAIREGVEKLRRRIFYEEEGSYIGSEPELMDFLDVSRPTFLQIVRILQNEQLIEVRRGRSGGYYTRNPTIDSVVGPAANYLVARGTTAEQFFHAGKVIGEELNRLACKSTDNKLREVVRKTMADIGDDVAKYASFVKFMHDEERLAKDLVRLADNPPLEMAAATNYFMAELQGKLDEFQPSQVILKRWRKDSLRHAQAVLDQDEEKALAISEKLRKQNMKLIQKADQKPGKRIWSSVKT